MFKVTDQVWGLSLSLSLCTATPFCWLSPLSFRLLTARKEEEPIMGLFQGCEFEIVEQICTYILDAQTHTMHCSLVYV